MSVPGEFGCHDISFVEIRIKYKQILEGSITAGGAEVMQ